MFAEEASRLKRRDEASQLRKLYFSIRWQLDQVKSGDSATRYGRTQRELIASLGGLAASSLIRMVSRNKQLVALTDSIFRSHANIERPFGLVMVCIGPKGLPDDADIVSISLLARESERDESCVINELEWQGFLLFSEKVFRQLIDRLIDDVLEGRLRLPVSLEKLSEIASSDGLKPEAKNQ
jgi:hypothetical protein